MMRAWWCLAVVACGGGGGGGNPLGPTDGAIDVPVDVKPDGRVNPFPDSSPDDASVVLVDAPQVFFDAPAATCNPLTQTGCNAGEKCTWWHDQDSPPIGHVGCAPNGTIAVGAACTEPAAGPLGYDDCVRGSYCIGGVCKRVCDLEGGAPTCAATDSCTRYADVFEQNGLTVAGVCDPGCDPLTQELASGAAACGSPIPDQPNKGCYGYDAFSCAPASMTSWSLTDRQPPRTNAAGNPFLNGCAPGFIPFFYEMTGSTRTLCAGFCAALDTDNTAALHDNALGSTTARAKLPLSPAAVAGDGTCAIGKKGSHATSRCRFMWPYVEDDAGNLPPEFEAGGYAETLGVCMAIGFFQYDSNDDLTPDTAYPDCANLPPRSVATTGRFDDAMDWQCYRRSQWMPQIARPGGPRSAAAGGAKVVIASPGSHPPVGGRGDLAKLPGTLRIGSSEPMTVVRHTYR